MEKDVNDAYVAMVLKNMYEKTSEEITLDAIINRALTDKITSETISQKVNAQMNAISAGIRGINPKFNEKSKNYDIVKSTILNSLTNYESALNEFSNFYDTKIEQLILRKVELESHLLGSVLRDEYLYKKENVKIDQKENDKVKKNIAKSLKEIISNVGKKKKENKTDVAVVNKALDVQDIENEITDKLDARVEKTKEETKKNRENIQKIEKEIRAINSEIKRINERKRNRRK